MTFVSTIAALGMMPAWIFLVGPYLTDGDLVIPFGQLLTSLVGLILPIALGMWIRWKWAKAGAIMQRIIVPFTLLTVLFILTAGVYINLFIFQLITPLMVAAGFVVAVCGYVFGAALAWAFRLSLPQITAVSIETSFQNGGIAFVLLKMSFPEPQGELASVAPVAQLMITGLPLWFVLAAVKLYGCYRARGGEKKTTSKNLDYEAVEDPLEKTTIDVNK
jgi:sodium/bile acid cotransporter 3/5